VNELDEYPNLVITQTLSKAYGLAGIRLGVCYASSQIAILNKIKPPYNVNELTQKSFTSFGNRKNSNGNRLYYNTKRRFT
jgi:histidinol-phosphate aminotransferase